MTICFSVALLSVTQAQDQEGKLIDRLLRPNTTLQNSAQNKKVVITAATVDSHGTVGTFYRQRKVTEKSFAGTRDFSTRKAMSRSFHGGDRTNVFSPNRVANTQTTYPTSSEPGLPPAHDSEKSIAGRSFADQRTFLDQGKSQKALNRQNPSLTIEQVRELLNKNK